MAFKKLDPTASMYLRGFDRRGCVATLNSTTNNSFQVSGIFSDVADFAVLMLYDADDLFGHLTTSKYLPDFNLHGVKLSFNLKTKGCFNPTSSRFPSVPWRSISYIKADDTSGTIALPISNIIGGAKAKSASFIVSGTPTTFDRIQLFYLSNILFDLTTITTGQSLAHVTQAMVDLINNYNYVAAQIPALTAVVGSNTSTFTVSYSSVGLDGNLVTLEALTKSGSATILTPNGPTTLADGLDPTSIQIDLDFTALGIDNVRQLWFTIAPYVPYPLGADPGLVFNQTEFSWVATNWVVEDTPNITPLKIAGPLSTLISSQDAGIIYNGAWGIEAGFFYHGFANAIATTGSSITITYTNGHLHDLYLGTALSTDRGVFSITLDGVSYGSINMSLNVASQLVTRRLLVENVSAGTHNLLLTITSTALSCYFDYIQAVVASDPIDPIEIYDNLSAALDIDTDQTYKLAPARILFILRQLGLKGNIDLYRGVFFSEVRQRFGGKFSSALVTIQGTWATGTGFGDGDSVTMNIAGTAFGVTIFPTDTNITIAQRLAHFINFIFVGVRSVVTGDTTTAFLTVTTTSPINGFTISAVASMGATGSIILTGDLIQGNEGIWRISPSKLSNSITEFPLNKGFIDWLSDFSSTTAFYGLGLTISVSQELLAPPDLNTSADSWTQRYADLTPVLTASTFGSWGTGYIESFSVTTGVTTIVSTAHGYITGNILHIDGIGTTYPITVINTNSFSIVGTPSVANRDRISISLQTSQCNFNPATVTSYLDLVFFQLCNYADTLQYGEILWWFFAGGTTSTHMAYYDAYTSAQASVVLGRALHLFNAPTDDPSVNSYADTNLLRSLLQKHIHSIRGVVRAATQRNTKFELLCAYDVNWPSNYTNVQYPFNIGGALNNYINILPEFMAPGGDVDQILMEALAWGTSYRTLDNAATTIEFPYTLGSWPKEQLGYLIPIQNGGCPWIQELSLAIKSEVAQIKLWAIDHIILFSWDFPIPLIANYKVVKPFYQPQTTTLGYLRTYMNNLINVPPPNTGGDQ